MLSQTPARRSCLIDTKNTIFSTAPKVFGTGWNSHKQPKPDFVLLIILLMITVFSGTAHPLQTIEQGASTVAAVGVLRTPRHRSPRHLVTASAGCFSDNQTHGKELDDHFGNTSSSKALHQATSKNAVGIYWQHHGNMANDNSCNAL